MTSRRIIATRWKCSRKTGRSSRKPFDRNIWPVTRKRTGPFLFTRANSLNEDDNSFVARDTQKGSAGFRLSLSDHPPLHSLPEIDQQLVGGFEAEQARAGVLDVEHDVDDDDREDCEGEHVQPTPVLATRHPKTGQQGTNETQAEQKRIDDPRRVILQSHRTSRRDVEHVV